MASKGDQKSHTVLQYVLCKLSSLHNAGPLNNHPLAAIAQGNCTQRSAPERLRDNLKKENTMKRISFVILLGMALIVGALPIAWATPDNQDKQKKERSHHAKGAEVGKRVRELRRYNSRLNAALTVFERKAERSGYSPKIDEAESFTMDPDSDGQSGALKLANPTSPFQKVGFKPGQTPDYSA